MSRHQPAYGPPQPAWGPPPPPKNKLSAGKFIGFGCLGIFALFVAIAILGAVVGSGDDAKNTAATATSSPGPSSTGDGKNSTSPTPATAKNEDAGTGRLPDMKSKGLQSAQDQAQAAGFYHLTSHDALGRGRMQVLDRNWKVCSQTPTAGDHPTDTKVDFGAVKLEESCPAKEQGTVEEAGATMPDLVGKSVKVARGALDSGTSITVTDASGDGRFIIVESNWQVCTQQPKAGTALDGQPVTFTAVKFGEPC